MPTPIGSSRENGTPPPLNLADLSASLPSRAPRLALQEIFVVPKTSQLDQLSHKSGQSHAEILRAMAPEDALKLEASHQRQCDALQLAQSLLPPEQVVSWAQASRLALSPSKAVIALGGDGHFNFVSHSVRDQIIIGVNSDPVLSHGNILRYVPADIPDIVERLLRGDYDLERWPRIKATLGDRVLCPATSEIFIGEREYMVPSRVEICFRGETILNRGNGLVIATGAGSTGLYSSASVFLGPAGDPYSPADNSLKFVMSQAMRPEIRRNQLISGEILPGEELKVRLKRGKLPMVSCDGMRNYAARGDWLSIKNSAKPLKVMVPRNPES